MFLYCLLHVYCKSARRMGCKDPLQLHQLTLCGSPGLKIVFRQCGQTRWPGKEIFTSSSLWPVKIVSERDCIFFLPRDKIYRFTGADLTAYSRIRVCVTDQHDWRVKLLACQDANLAGHYFEHCSSTSKKYSHTLITTAMQTTYNYKLLYILTHFAPEWQKKSH